MADVAKWETGKAGTVLEDSAGCTVYVFGGGLYLVRLNLAAAGLGCTNSLRHKVPRSAASQHLGQPKSNLANRLRRLRRKAQ